MAGVRPPADRPRLDFCELVAMTTVQLGLLLLVVAGLFFLLSRYKAHQSGLPSGKIVYSDNRVFQSLPRPLYDSALNLAGKPDYIVALKDGTFIPVEYKSHPAPDRPYDSHVLQLTAYCYLCEISYGRRPPHGLIRYADKTFQIDYTPQQESVLIEVITAMRSCECQSVFPNRSHHQTSRCRACGYRSLCDQRL